MCTQCIYLVCGLYCIITEVEEQTYQAYEAVSHPMYPLQATCTCIHMYVQLLLIVDTKRQRVATERRQCLLTVV